MTESQRIWAAARDRLEAALRRAGFPGELAGLLAQQLKSPKAIDRMTAFVRDAHPRSMEMLADEMLAICADVEGWREKKASRDAQAGYNAMLFSGVLGRGDEDREDIDQ